MKFAVKNICLCMVLGLLSVSASAQTAFWKSVRQGNRAFRSGDFDKAEKIYHQALAKDTANPYILYNLGNVNFSKNNTEDAQRYLQNAAKSNKQPSTEKTQLLKAYANHNLGVIHQMQAGKEKDKKQEELQQAIEYYKEALRNNPSDEDTRYNLALCQYQLKKEQQNQQNQQEQQNQQNKNENKDQDKDKQDKQDQKQDQQQNQNEQRNNPEKQPVSPQTQQMMNLSRQEEQKTRDKLNKIPRGRTGLEKNW